MTKLTIITTCKNEAASIEKTIESVVEQNYVDYEYIIIDGGSTDETVGIIKKYERYISTFVSEKDRGIWHAMNKGISLAKGEYVYFINAGDMLYDRNTLKMIFGENNVNEDIIYGDIIDNYGDHTVHKKFSDTITIRYLLGNMICHQAMFIKRSLHEQYGLFDEQYKYVADYDFLWRCIVKHKATYRHIACPIAFYDMHGLTADPLNREQLVAEWNRVQYNNLPIFKYYYIHYIKPRLLKYDAFSIRILSKILSKVIRID